MLLITLLDLRIEKSIDVVRCSASSKEAELFSRDDDDGSALRMEQGWTGLLNSSGDDVLCTLALRILDVSETRLSCTIR